MIHSLHSCRYSLKNDTCFSHSQSSCTIHKHIIVHHVNTLNFYASKWIYYSKTSYVCFKLFQTTNNKIGVLFYLIWLNDSSVKEVYISVNLCDNQRCIRANVCIKANLRDNPKYVCAFLCDNQWYIGVNLCDNPKYICAFHCDNQWYLIGEKKIGEKWLKIWRVTKIFPD